MKNLVLTKNQAIAVEAGSRQSVALRRQVGLVRFTSGGRIVGLGLWRPVSVCGGRDGTLEAMGEKERVSIVAALDRPNGKHGSPRRLLDHAARGRLPFAVGRRAR